jgi:uncharacterized OB-fold protein
MTLDATDYAKPLPFVTRENREFWEGCLRGELRFQKCARCGHVRYPAATLCPNCLFEEAEWIRSSGRGRLWSWIVFHKAYMDTFSGDLPYNVALVELDEVPFIMSSMVDPVEDLEIGAEVEVVFDQVTPDIALPKFKLSRVSD